MLFCHHFIWPVISYGVAILSNANNDLVKYLSPPLALISHPTWPGRSQTQLPLDQSCCRPRRPPSPAPRLYPLLRSRGQAKRPEIVVIIVRLLLCLPFVGGSELVWQKFIECVTYILQNYHFSFLSTFLYRLTGICKSNSFAYRSYSYI